MIRFSRCIALAAILIVAAKSFAAVNAFLKIPGVNGSSSFDHRVGWSDVQNHSLTLLPAVQDDKKKTFVSQCIAYVSTMLGAGARKQRSSSERRSTEKF